MKRILSIIAVSFICAATGRAQWIVYDPTSNIQQIMNQVESVAKYVEMINNQVQQIQTLTSQLNELQHYNQIFGNPSQILNLAGFTGVITDLRNTGIGQTIGQLENLAQGVDALRYDASGLYHNIGETFTTRNGNSVARDQNSYRQFAAVNQTTKNFSDVYADVIARRQALKQDIAATTTQLRAATTASEVQKLTGLLVSQNAALAATDKELDQALALSQVQDAENRNDQAKQDQARIEEQRAEFSESIQKYNNTVKLTTEPAQFPEGNQ